MNQCPKLFYEFGPFRLDEVERRLLRDGEEVVVRENGKGERLTAKAFDLLLALVKQRGHMIERDKLLGQLWPGTYVEDNRLSDNISTLRKFLGDRAKKSSYIETVPKHGYRFVAEVREVRDEMVALVEHTRTRIVIEEEGDESANSAVPVLPHLPHTVELALAAADAAVPPRRLGRRRTALTLLLLALVIGGGSWLFVQLRATTPARAFEKVKFVRLTAGGRLGNARITGGVSISPNGKYVVLWTEESGLHSLWVRQVATSSTQRIFGPADGIFGGTTFSPDGAFVYFSGLSEAQPANVLYRVPVLGGVPATVSTGVDSPITFSPDGKQYAFVRLDEGQGASSLIVRDMEKGTERILVTRRIPDAFTSAGPAWSPDGKLIACGGWTITGDTYSTVLIAPAEGGPVRPVTTQRWSVVCRVAWAPDGSGLIVAAAEQGYEGARTQIWHVSYPHGEARRITNDLNGYGQVSLDVVADAKTIVTVQEDFSSQIWLAPLANPAIRSDKKDKGAGPATQISHGKYDGLYGFAWMPDGKIVYLTQADHHNIDIWEMNADGSGATQLTSDAHFEYFPSVSPDGRYILFSSNRAGNWNIWRIDADSQNAHQLTTGTAADNAPICSPDGRWVVFNSFRAGKQTIWKVPIDGGEPMLITDQHAALPAISPDGKWIAYSYSDVVSGRRQKLAIIPFEGGRPVRVFDLPVSFGLRSGFAWTSDGEAVLYVNNPAGVGNIWAQPTKGGGPAQLTYFTTRPISRFALSPDGKQIAVSYQSVSDDVVLIRDLR